LHQDAVFEAAYGQALDEGFAQGPVGYARDTVLAMGRWPFNLAMINVPVDIWYGEQDNGCSPDNGAMLAARIPGARRHVAPGIGGAVVWTHAKPILRSLLDSSRWPFPMDNRLRITRPSDTRASPQGSSIGR
jgi:pimeloyl-ACP methyl ester carboxylesterase